MSLARAKQRVFGTGVTCNDLSKLSPTEFLRVEYYQGTRSPKNAEREATGVSLARLRHKDRNEHHYKYWGSTIFFEKRLLAHAWADPSVSENVRARIC